MGRLMVVVLGIFLLTGCLSIECRPYVGKNEAGAKGVGVVCITYPPPNGGKPAVKIGYVPVIDWRNNWVVRRC